MTSLRVFSVITFLILIFSTTLSAQTAREFYNRGLELKEQDKVDEAIKVFENTIKKDRKFPEAYYELSIKITDNVAQTSVIKTVLMRLFENKS
ncbi:hypothetical protein ACFL5P_03425 [candidate division KSB1 bacterium]